MFNRQLREQVIMYHRQQYLNKRVFNSKEQALDQLLALQDNSSVLVDATTSHAVLENNHCQELKQQLERDGYLTSDKVHKKMSQAVVDLQGLRQVFERQFFAV